MKLHVKAWNRVRPHTVAKLYDTGGAPMATAGGQQMNPFAVASGSQADEAIQKYRMLRAAIPWLAAGVDIRSEGVIFAEKEIVAKDSDHQLTEAEKSTAKDIDAFFENPDPAGVSTSAQLLFGPWIADALIGGRGAMRLYLDEQNNLEKLRTLDARRLKDNPKYDFDDPDAQEELKPDGNPKMPRYFYMEMDQKTGMISKTKGEPLMAREVCVLQPTPTSYGDGLSPLVYLDAYLDAHQEVFRSIRQVQVEGQPPGVFKIPSAQPNTIAKLQSEWKRRARGKVSTVFASLPADTEWVAMGDTNLSARGAFSFMDIIVRGVAAALRISTVALGWTQTTLERNAAAQGESQDEGQFNLLRMVQAAINSGIMPFFQNADNLVWRYTALPSDDEAENAETIAQWSGGHFVIPSPDQLRERAGLNVIERKDGTPLDKAYKDMWVVTGGGPVPLHLYLGLTQMQVVPGYDPETGEVDDEKALAEQKHKQDTLAPPMAPGMPGAPSGPPGAPGGPPVPGGHAPAQNGTSNGSSSLKQLLTGTVPVGAKKSVDEPETDEEIAAQLAAELAKEYPWSTDELSAKRDAKDDGPDAA